jgi:hypothetical protein
MKTYTVELPAVFRFEIDAEDAEKAKDQANKALNFFESVQKPGAALMEAAALRVTPFVTIKDPRCFVVTLNVVDHDDIMEHTEDIPSAKS